MARPIATRTTPSAAPVAKAGSRAMIPVPPDRANRHQHIDRERPGVTLGKRLESVGLLRRTLSPMVLGAALFLPVEGPLRPDRARVRSSARKTGFLV